MRPIRSAGTLDDKGFTLPEVLTVIAVMGIIAAIAVPTWWSIAESRRVDTAANQLASDLRLAHTRANNQLTQWRIVYSNNSGTYNLASDGNTVSRSFEDAKVLDSEIGGTGSTIRFEPNGIATVDGFTDADGDGEFDITVSTIDGNPQRVISLNTATSRVELD